MSENSALAEFKQGINLLRDGHSAEALEYLRHAAEWTNKTRITFPSWECLWPVLNENGRPQRNFARQL